MHFSLPGPDAVEQAQISFNEASSQFNRTLGLYSIDILLSWTAPTEPNGMITGYQFNVTETESDAALLSDTTNTTSVETQSGGVQPYTNYTLSVVASTDAGSGDISTAIVESPEAGRQSFAL